jgi:CRISPR-associated protein (TIGR02710 family)
MNEVSAKALIMVVSRVDAVERAVERLAPEAVAVVSSQDIFGEVAVECRKLGEKAKFLYGIVDSPMEIRDSFGRFEYLFGELRKMGYSPEGIVLDATGGTTTMRLGAALAAISEGVRMIHQRVPMDYVDGEWERDESKDVEIVPMENPLESTGLLREGQGVELFDRRDYAAAALIFHDVALKVEGAERGHYYTGLALLADGYAAWDVADYGTALEKLSAARKEFSVGFSDSAFAGRAARLAAMIPAHLEFLGKVRGRLSAEKVADMLENARRRIADQGRYDDGVARLYRCVEMFHQWRLHEEHGIKATGTNWNKVPEEARTKFMEKAGVPELPAHLNLGHARALDAVLSGTSVEDSNLFRDLLRQRNNSILAHGLEPIGENSARRFLEYVDEIVGEARISVAARHIRLRDV